MKPGGVSSSKKEGGNPLTLGRRGVCGDLGCVQMGMELEMCLAGL